MGGKLPTKTYLDIDKKKKDFETYRNKLKLKSIELGSNFSSNYPNFEKLLKEKNLKLSDIRKHSAHVLGASALTGALLISPPKSIGNLLTPTELIDNIKKEGIDSVSGIQQLLVDNMKLVLPDRPRSLSQNEEKVLEQLFEQVMGVKAKATLEGEHLNQTFGYIGAEQHLRRFPGDTIGQHGDLEDQKEGMAPGLGAWGYFSSTKDKLSPYLEDVEKWYAVVQTLYLPGWNTRQPFLKNWYKYRKVLIVNTVNGNAVVAAIADSGPAAWTGKHFGGSPEVMDYLGGPRYKKGPVLIFFVDDPENKVPLGPVEYNKLNLAEKNQSGSDMFIKS